MKSGLLDLLPWVILGHSQKNDRDQLKLYIWHKAHQTSNSCMSFVLAWAKVYLDKQPWVPLGSPTLFWFHLVLVAQVVQECIAHPRILYPSWPCQAISHAPLDFWLYLVLMNKVHLRPAWLLIQSLNSSTFLSRKQTGCLCSAQDYLTSFLLCRTRKSFERIA